MENPNAGEEAVVVVEEEAEDIYDLNEEDEYLQRMEYLFIVGTTRLNALLDEDNDDNRTDWKDEQIELHNGTKEFMEDFRCEYDDIIVDDFHYWSVLRFKSGFREMRRRAFIKLIELSTQGRERELDAMERIEFNVAYQIVAIIDEAGYTTFQYGRFLEGRITRRQYVEMRAAVRARRTTVVVNG